MWLTGCLGLRGSTRRIASRLRSQAATCGWRTRVVPRDDGDEKDKGLCMYGLQFLRMFSGETIQHMDAATRFLRPWDTRDLGDLQAFATVLDIVTLARGFQFGLNVSLDSETDRGE